MLEPAVQLRLVHEEPLMYSRISSKEYAVYNTVWVKRIRATGAKYHLEGADTVGLAGQASAVVVQDEEVPSQQVELLVAQHHRFTRCAIL